MAYYLQNRKIIYLRQDQGTAEWEIRLSAPRKGIFASLQSCYEAQHKTSFQAIIVFLMVFDDSRALEGRFTAKNLPPHLLHLIVHTKKKYLVRAEMLFSSISTPQVSHLLNGLFGLPNASAG